MMAERQYYLGIDAAKAWLEVGSWPGSERLRVAPTLTVERTLEQPKPGLHSRPQDCRSRRTMDLCRASRLRCADMR
jgi:hypothetical protein